MTQLYTQQSFRRCEKAAKASLIWAILLVTVFWGLCAFLCTRVRTANAALLFRWVLGLSILSGWAAILILAFIYRPNRAEKRHIQSMLNEPWEEMEGVFYLEDSTFQIPRGIRVQKARLETAEEPVSLRLDARYAHLLPLGQPVKIRVIRQYITAYEVLP